MRYKRSESEYQWLRQQAEELYRNGKARTAIAVKLAVSLKFVNRALLVAELWDPADDAPHNEPARMPTPEEIRRACLLLKEAKGHLRPEEKEELLRA